MVAPQLTGPVAFAALLVCDGHVFTAGGDGARHGAPLGTTTARDRRGAGAKGRGTDIDRIGSRQPASVDALGGPSQLRRRSTPPARSSALAATQHPMSGTTAGRHHSRSGATNLRHPETGNGLGNDSSVKANSVRAAETCGRPASRVAVSPTRTAAAAPRCLSEVCLAAAPNVLAAPTISVASLLDASVSTGRRSASGA